MDAFNNSSFGTNYNSGASFKSPPILPHGLNGIIIGHDCTIGKNVIIHQ
jgi:serine acetyltransferase